MSLVIVDLLTDQMEDLNQQQANLIIEKWQSKRKTKMKQYDFASILKMAKDQIAKDQKSKKLNQTSYSLVLTNKDVYHQMTQLNTIVKTLVIENRTLKKEKKLYIKDANEYGIELVISEEELNLNNVVLNPAVGGLEYSEAHETHEYILKQFTVEDEFDRSTEFADMINAIFER